MSTIDPDKDTDLTSHLDTLLTHYLHLLDTHRTHQSTATAAFRAGLFSLTEANFRTPNRGTRYGQDLYDDKMQASLVLEHIPDEREIASSSSSSPSSSPEAGETEVVAGRPGGLGGPEACFRGFRARRLATATASKGGVVKRSEGVSTDGNGDGGTGNDDGGASNDNGAGGKVVVEPDLKRSMVEGESGSDRGERDEAEIGKDAADDDETDGSQMPTPPETRGSAPAVADANANESSLPRDPIRQFGILVPPALRAAQGSFSKAVESWIDSLTADVELQRLELEIRRTRKRIRKTTASTEHPKVDKK